MSGRVVVFFIYLNKMANHWRGNLWVPSSSIKSTWRKEIKCIETIILIIFFLHVFEPDGYYSDIVYILYLLSLRPLYNLAAPQHVQCDDTRWFHILLGLVQESVLIHNDYYTSEVSWYSNSISLIQWNITFTTVQNIIKLSKSSSW